MASYYKYAERKVENQVDWSAISKGVTESIEAEKISRDGRKAAIDKASNESMIAMMEKPQGEYAKENDRVANFAEQAQSAMLNNSKLLKSGSISEREYSSLVNNLDTGTKMAFNLSKKYQDAYQGHVERMTANKDGVTMGSNLEVDQLAYVESSFGPGANSQYVIAPSGEVQIAQMTKMDEDGEQVQVGPLTSLNGASNMIVQQIDRYQTLGAVEGITDQIGKKIDALIGKENGEGTPGYITARERTYKALLEAEEGGSNALELAIKSSFANSDGMASFLSDTLGSTEEGTPYQLLFKGGEAWTKLKKEGGLDKNGMPKDSSFILREQGPQGNWTSKLSTSQEARVIDSMKDLVEQKLDVKETVVGDPNFLNEKDRENMRLKRLDLVNKHKGNKIKDEDRLTNVEKISGLYDGDKLASIQYFEALDKNSTTPVIKQIVPTETGVTINYLDEDRDPLVIDYGTDKKLFMQTAAAGLSGLKDISKEIKKLGLTGDEEANLELLEGRVVERKTLPSFRNAKFKGTTDVKDDVNVVEILNSGGGESNGIDWKTSFFGGNESTLVTRAEQMKENAGTIFSVLQKEIPGLEIDYSVSKRGLTLQVPSVFEGVITLPSASKEKNRYNYAIEKIYDAIARGIQLKPSDITGEIPEISEDDLGLE